MQQSVSTCSQSREMDAAHGQTQSLSVDDPRSDCEVYQESIPMGKQAQLPHVCQIEVMHISSSDHIRASVHACKTPPTAAMPLFIRPSVSHL